MAVITLSSSSLQSFLFQVSLQSTISSSSQSSLSYLISFSQKYSNSYFLDEKDENVEVGPVDGVKGIRNDTWSGAILDTDMVQNVMPGGRIMSHRCLVVVGNLKGAAGFGVGKSSTPDKALNLAFR